MFSKLFTLILISLMPQIALGLPSEDLVEAIQDSSEFSGYLHFERHGQELISDFYGVKDPQSHLPYQGNEWFWTGFLAKTLIAQVIYNYSLDGRLSLSDDVSVYFPELSVGSLKYGQQPLKIKHLLSQTGGLSEPWLKQRRNILRRNSQEVLSTLQKGLIRRPGEEFVYNDMSYFVLGELILRISQESLYSVFRQELSKINIDQMRFLGLADADLLPKGFLFSGFSWIHASSVTWDFQGSHLSDKEEQDQTLIVTPSGMKQWLRWQLFSPRSILSLYRNGSDYKNFAYFGGFFRMRDAGRTYYINGGGIESHGSTSFLFLDPVRESGGFLMSHFELGTRTKASVINGMLEKSPYHIELGHSLNEVIWAIVRAYRGWLVLLVLIAVCLIDYGAARSKYSWVTKLRSFGCSLFPNHSENLWGVVNFCLISTLILSFYMAISTAMILGIIACLCIVVIGYVNSYVWFSLRGAFTTKVIVKELILGSTIVLAMIVNEYHVISHAIVLS